MKITLSYNFERYSWKNILKNDFKGSYPRVLGQDLSFKIAYCDSTGLEYAFTLKIRM